MKHISIDECLQTKKEAKTMLSKTFKLSEKRPLLGVILDKDLTKAMEKQIGEILEGAAAIDVPAIVLADTNLDFLKKQKIAVMEYSRENRNTLLRAADIALSLPFNDIEEMLLNGTIPVTELRPEVTDYNPNKETGNAFVFKGKSTWDIFASLVRAIETYKFPYDWKHIIREGLRSVEK